MSFVKYLFGYGFLVAGCFGFFELLFNMVKRPDESTVIKRGTYHLGRYIIYSILVGLGMAFLKGI